VKIRKSIEKTMNNDIVSILFFVLSNISMQGGENESSALKLGVAHLLYFSKVTTF
jgi:hypothetical protein